ncbi:MAG: MobF family relaxase, partial [Chthoniobacterales bacterium]
LDPRTQERLTARTKNHRTAGYDFTFSVPKSVSLYLARNPGSEVRQMIMDSFSETMTSIEAEMKTRVRGRGADGRERHEERVTGNLVYAAFVHDTSRPVDGIPDPHFHIHSYVLNATFDRVENRWKAGFFRELKADAPFWEASFNARVAERLLAASYGIRRTERDFELANVDRSLIEKFSRRTQEIEKLARENLKALEKRARALVAKTGMSFGQAFAQVKGELGAKTREAKDKGPMDQAKRLEHWDSLLTEDERRALSAEAVKAAASKDLLDARAAQDLAIEEIFERSSTSSKRRLVAQALRRGIGSLSVPDAEHFGDRDARVLQGKLNRVTTHTVAEEERRIITMVNAGKGALERLDPLKSWRPINPHLNPQQQMAIHHLLGSSDQFVAIRGAAGTGKTTMMKEAVPTLAAFAERDVAVFAPSSAATDVLRCDGFEGAETFQMLQHNQRLQEEVAAKIIWVDEAGFLSAKQMLWLAEFAKRNGNRVILSGDTHQHHSVERGDMLRILEKAEAISTAQLTEILRQQEPELRAAVFSLSEGDIAKGFEALDVQGRITELEDDSERVNAIIEAHLGALKEGKTSVIVSPTHAEGRHVAESLRAAMREQGLLTGEEVKLTRLQNTGWTYALRCDAINYAPGQVIEFHQRTQALVETDRYMITATGKSGLKRLEAPGLSPLTLRSDGEVGDWVQVPHREYFQRGEKWEVVSATEGKILLERSGVHRSLSASRASSFSVFEKEEILVAVGDTVRVTKTHRSIEGRDLINNDLLKVIATADGLVRFDNGESLGVKELAHIDQGHVVTSHASQGKTVDQVLISAPVNSFDLVNAIMFYVSVSRGRKQARVFTDSKAALLETIETNLGTRLSASELLNEVAQTAEEKVRAAARKERLEAKRDDLELKEAEFEARRLTERKSDKAILAKLYRSGRLPGGRRADKLRAAKELLAKLTPDELRELGPTLGRIIAGAERGGRVALPIARRSRNTQSKKPGKKTVTNYERELRQRFAQRFPSPTPEQSAKIERKIDQLMTRQRQAPAAQAVSLELLQVKSYETRLRTTLATKYPNLTPAQARQLEARVGQLVAQYRAGLAARAQSVKRYHQPQTRTQTQDKEITRER